VCGRRLPSALISPLFLASFLVVFLYDLVTHPDPLPASSASDDIHTILQILMRDDEFRGASTWMRIISRLGFVLLVLGALIVWRKSR
jgi:hypothetical protein